MLAKLKLSLMSVGLMAMVLVGACGAESKSASPTGDDHEQEVTSLAAIDLAQGEKLKVVATTNIVGDLVHNVGGELIDLATMLPTDTDPHTFTPTPQDVAAVADAHVVFVNGLHLEEFLDDLIENAGGDAPVVVLATDVKTRKFETTERDTHEDDHGHQGADPHIWTTPTNAMVMVQNVQRALQELDPANSTAYAANAGSYAAELEELDAWVMAQIGTIPQENRKLVTDHDTLGYYADRYGLEVVGAVLPAYSSNAEPSAQELAELQQQIQELDVKAIFVGATVNPVLAERTAADSGIQMVPLFTGSLGEAGSGAENYLDYVRKNTTAMVEALR